MIDTDLLDRPTVTDPEPPSAEALFEEAHQRRRTRRRRSATVVALALMAALAGYDAAGGSGGASPQPASQPTPPTPPASTDLRWTLNHAAAWQHGTGGNDVNLGASALLTCPHGSSTCYAVVQANGIAPNGTPTTPGEPRGFARLRSSLYRSGDGGRHWAPVAIPSDVWLSTPLTCSTERRCAVGALVDPGGSPGVGGSTVLLTTLDGGQRWHSQPLPAPVALVRALACPSANECLAVAVGAAGARFSVGGSPPASGVDRFSPTEVVVTADGGASWTFSSLPIQVGTGSVSLTTLTCASTTDCVAGGEAAHVGAGPGGYRVARPRAVLLASTDGGKSFGHLDQRSGYVAQALSCGGRSCMALMAPISSPVRDTLLRSIDGGRSWREVASTGLPSTSALHSLSCSRADACVAAVGLDGLVSTTDGGRDWGATRVPSPSPQVASPGRASVDQVSCPRANACVALEEVSEPTFAQDTEVLVGVAGGRRAPGAP